MRILDQESDKPLNRLTLYLLRSEAQELRDALNELLNEASHHHSHISAADYRKEVTVCLYQPDVKNGFDARSQQLIDKDI